MGKPIFQRCNDCNGTGSKPTRRQYVDRHGVSHDEIVDEDCKPCDGSGKIYIGEEPEPGSRA